MVERKLLISGLGLGYEGLFDVSEFFKFIEDWFAQNGYNKNELKNFEKVTEKGKTIQFDVMPWKEINDYTKYEIYFRMRIDNLTETKVKKSGKEMKINKGKISITIDAFTAHDVRYRLEGRPLYFFLRTIFNKFVNKEYIQRFEQGLMEDVKNFHGELKAYLNLERYKEQA